MAFHNVLHLGNYREFRSKTLCLVGQDDEEIDDGVSLLEIYEA